MAAIHGSMPAFELFQPASVDDAVALLARHRANAWVLAGGLDTFEWLADRIKRPAVLVDLAGIAGLSGVRETPQGVEIGAMTTLAAIATDPVITGRYRLLADAAMAVASPQIRNQGTIGGNVSQSARCWYYRAGWPCYRAGGNICYADTPTGANREHAIFDLDRCVAVNPSDTAPALVALDAEMVVRSPRGERVVPADDFFVGPATEITRMTVLEPDDLLTGIRLPATWSRAQFYFEKVRDRQVWDFALVNIAAALQTAGGAIRDLRLVVNGVAARPKRLRAVEAAVRGKPRSEATAQAAGDLAIAGAEPLRHNAYKVALTRNLVRRAIRGAGGVLTT
jgi:xanthine dehydrogenase YagS FAD-binding subunit